mmetsp:Transcript_45000/g.88076  ORF Transcript_45000/g.88076 Transcript_45000/m.88076 type:complete len:360 (+) Transcript_45000:126-1205(+)
MMPSARLPLLFLLLLRSPRVSADDQSKSLLGAITDATSEAIGALEDVTNPLEEVDLGKLVELVPEDLLEMVDLDPENVDIEFPEIPKIPIAQIPKIPWNIPVDTVGEAVAAGIEESRGVGEVVSEEVIKFLSDTVQDIADNPDEISPMDLVEAAVATIGEFTSFTINADDLMEQLLEMAAMTAEELDAFDLEQLLEAGREELLEMATMTPEDLADVVSDLLEDSVIVSIYESFYAGIAEMATEEGIDLEALQATFAENMEDLDPLEVDDLAGAMITTIQETFGIEINPEPLTAAARTLIENPATFDPNDLTFAVSAAVSQETVETVDPGTAMEESGTARCGRASFLLVAMVLSLFGILA